MPILTGPVTELTDHIFYPVAKQISHRLLQIFGLTDYIGDNIYLNSDFTANNYTHKLNKDAIVGRDAFRVEFKPNLNPSNVKWDFYTFKHTTAYGINRRTMMDNAPIYEDPFNKVKIVEMRSPITLELNCSIEVESADKAYTLPQMIYNRYESGAIIEYSDLFFDYPVPKAVINVLYQIYKQDKIFGAPTGNSFKDYVDKFSLDLWDRTINKDVENNLELTVPVRNLQALGTLEFSGDGPEVEKEGSAPEFFRIPFTYTVQFGLPTLNIMEYPVAISNTPLPTYLFQTENTSRYNRLEEHQHYRPELFFEKLNHYYPQGCLHVPMYDDWYIPNNYPDLRLPWMHNKEPFIILNVLLDNTEDLTTELDLSGDIDPSFKFHPYVLEVLKEEGEEAVERDAFINVQLFRDDHCLKANEDFKFTSDLKCIFKGVNIYSHYRLVLSISTDLEHINPKWYYLLAKYFIYIPNNLKESIALLITNEVWRALEYSNDKRHHPLPWYISRDGYLLDANQNLIVELATSIFAKAGKDLNGTLLTGYNIGGDNAFLKQLRVFRNSIITRQN